MLNRYLLSSCLISSTIVMVSTPTIAREALLPEEVANLAKATVVQITPTMNYPGSGVIVGSYKENNTNVYVVLTANHVVQYKDDEYQIITPVPLEGERKRRKISITTDKDIQRLRGVDLAVVRFRSNHKFKVAKLGDSDYVTEGSGIYVAGFPNPGQAIKKRVFQFTSSLVSSRLDAEAVDGEEETAVENGYAISYTATTRAGMSGGPVFDVSGRVIGIHGRGDREEAATRTIGKGNTHESGSQTVPDKTGFNLAIPIQTFVRRLVPNAISKLGISLDKSEPGKMQLISTRGDRKTINITEEESVDAVSEEVKQPSKNNNPSRSVNTEIKSSDPQTTEATPYQNTTPEPSGSRLW